MQIDDLSFADRPSDIDDPYLRKVTVLEKCLDSLQFRN